MHYKSSWIYLLYQTNWLKTRSTTPVDPQHLNGEVGYQSNQKLLQQYQYL